MANDRCKIWRETNKEKIRQDQHEYYINNKEHRHAYLLENKEKNNAKALMRYHALSPEKQEIRKKQSALFSKEQRLRRKAVIDQMKIQTGCQNPLCQWGGDFQSCDLDFHHIDVTTKKKSVALLMNGSATILIEEIRKCTVLCAICHRRATYADLDCSSFKLCEVLLAEDALK